MYAETYITIYYFNILYIIIYTYMYMYTLWDGCNLLKVQVLYAKAYVCLVTYAKII